MKQTIYVVTSKTGNETHLIEAYTSENAAIEHMNNAKDWYNKWILNPIQILAQHYSIWPEGENPYDNITPDIIDDNITYDWQEVTLNE